jgi:hypothetical protein
MILYDTVISRWGCYNSKMSLHVTQLLVRRTLYIAGYGNRIQNGPHDCCGVYESSGFKGKTHQSGQSCPEQPERGTKQHNGWPAAGASYAPSRDPTSSSFISESRPGDFLHAPLCGLALSHSGFLARDYLEKTLETT